MAKSRKAPADPTWTEFEVFCERMGWDPSEATKDRVESLGGKRGAVGHWDRLQLSPSIYKQCGICGNKFCVNNWLDHKSRTPRLGGFVICPDCDPRHLEDRYLREGYRILHPRRLRLVRMAQITRAMATQPCMKLGDKKCKCPSCTARKVVA